MKAILIFLGMFSIVASADESSCLIGKMEIVGKDLINTNWEETVAIETVEKTVVYSKKVEFGEDLVVKITYKGIGTATETVIMKGNTNSCAITNIDVP